MNDVAAHVFVCPLCVCAQDGFVHVFCLCVCFYPFMIKNDLATTCDQISGKHSVM